MSELSEKWSVKQQQYIAWLATPRYDRIPPTQELLAEQLNVTARTLTRWSKRPGWWESVADLAESYLHEDLPAIYGALKREADKGSFQHIKLALELTGRYTERREFSGPGGGPIIVQWDDDTTDSD